MAEPADGPRTGLIVALDNSDLDRADALAEELAPDVWAFKIGLTLFSRHGRAAIERVSRHGRVFCDLKFHDIPHQVGLAAAELATQKVWMFTVHASGGATMIGQAVKAALEVEHPPLVAAVTVLTSLSEGDLTASGQDSDIQSQVLRLAKLAADSGAGAIVSSARHISLLRESLGPEVVLVTPGIRSDLDDAGDQVQTMTATEAATRGANYIVVGRPITDSADPAEAARRFTAEYNAAFPSLDRVDRRST